MQDCDFHIRVNSRFFRALTHGFKLI